MHFITGTEALDPPNNSRVDPADVCRHQRAGWDRGGVLQQQELQEGHLLPQGGGGQKQKNKTLIKNLGNISEGCAGHKADVALPPLPLLPKCQPKGCAQEEGPWEGGEN